MCSFEWQIYILPWTTVKVKVTVMHTWRCLSSGKRMPKMTLVRSVAMTQYQMTRERHVAMTQYQRRVYRRYVAISNESRTSRRHDAI